MGGSTSAKTLASILRAANEVRPVVLLGAGASFRSGVPLAAEAVKRIAKVAYIRLELSGKAHPSQVKLTQWLPWLQRQNWFIHGDERLAENFPLAVEHLLRPDEFRREVLLDLMQPLNGVSSGYHVVADLMLRGLVWTVLTTNFDPCFPQALRAKQPHLKQFAQVNRGRNDFAEFSVMGRRQLFAKELPREFQHAAVALTRAGKGRVIVGGNLLHQLQELKEWLDAEDVNPALRVKGRRTYQERTAYPARSLVELLVNLLVHRDYQTAELAEIDVDAGPRDPLPQSR